MGYHNVRLPTQFSQGSRFGPGFNTRVIQLDSLAEHRVRRGPDAGQRSYSLEQGINARGPLRELYEFYIARGGAENSFRLKDWLDYATNATRTTEEGDPPVAFSDQELLPVGGSTTVFQFVTRYLSGPTTVVRPIKKIVDGTVKVGDHSGALGAPVDLTAGGGFTIQLEDGTVTFAVAPTQPVTGGCEFDVVARFSEETDRAFLVAIEVIGTGALPEIRCTEDVDPVTVSQDYPFGGAKNHGAIGAAYNLSELEGKLQTFAPTVARDLVLPDKTNLPTGGIYFAINNTGSATLTVKDAAVTITTIIAGAAKQLWLGVDAAGAKLWVSF